MLSRKGSLMTRNVEAELLTPKGFILELTLVAVAVGVVVGSLAVRLTTLVGLTLVAILFWHCARVGVSDLNGMLLGPPSDHQ